MSKHRVSIIIVTCNSLPALEDSLARLKQLHKNTGFELIVVDNNSSDQSISRVRSYFSAARIMEMNENVGFAAACNQAAWVASGEFLLFHNPDLVLDEGAIERLLGTWQSRDRVGAVTGRMRFPDGSFQATCRQFPSPGNIVFSRGSVFTRLFGNRGKYTLEDFAEVTEVPSVAGTLLAVKKDLFMALGGFDECFFMYMEDTDLCLRLNRAGYINYFVPGAGGVHLWGKGSRGGKLKRNWYHHISFWKYFRKHFPGTASLFIMPLVLGIHLVLASLLGRPVARN
ncbi:MAG: glycosyltransferase family 2 protein [Candidatus Zixiibacteriota bacterium]|nr:MAG: glycosyltransferase family 2 protein [candidate division Zixibacteria bacterium]